MDETNSTDGPEVFRESVADVALKSYTLYFLVTAILLGLLLLAAIRKTARICCWRCMYGLKYARYEKEDPRVPSTLFRTPSILTTLQDHYDKGRSLRSTAKSEATSRSYVSAQDIESAIGNENARVGRYLDTEDAQSDGASLDRAEVTSEFSRATTILESEGNTSGTREDGDLERTDGDDLNPDAGGDKDNGEGEVKEFDTSDDLDTEKRDTNVLDLEEIEDEKGTVEDLGTKYLGTESDNGEIEVNDDECTDTSTKEGCTKDSEGSQISVPVPTGETEGTEESVKTSSDVDDHSTCERTTAGTDCSFYVSEIAIEQDTVTTGGRTNPDIELQEIADPDSFTTGRHQSVSEESVGSTVSDNAPLVSRQAPSESSRRGRYKKNTGQKIISGSSARSTSAKLTKRVNKQI